MAWDWLTTGLLSGGGIFSAIKSVNNVINEGERGILLTMGKAARHKKGTLKGKVKVYSPASFRVIIPFLQKFKKIHIKKNTHTIENLTVTFDDNLSYNFNASLFYHIPDDPDAIESVLTTVGEIEEFIALTFGIVVQDVMYRQTSADKVNLMTSLADKIKRKVEIELKEHGFVVDKCGIYNFVETSVSQSLRGVDYRIQKALEHKGEMPNIVLAAAIGATPTVTACDDPAVSHSHVDEDGNLKEPVE